MQKLKPNNKHLTLTDRYMIERMLTTGYSFKEIAKSLNRSPSTISREVKNHRRFVQSKMIAQNNCDNYFNCLKIKICDKKGCMRPCRRCPEQKCNQICDEYSPMQCLLLEKKPYVCNNCLKRDICNKNRAYYDANAALGHYQKLLSDARKGPRASFDEICDLDKLISPLIRQGQSLSHIFASHSDEILYSRKTIYNYIDIGFLSVKNIDLPRKVRYRKRRSKTGSSISYKYRIGRTYQDFLSYAEQFPDLGVVEMDTVKGTHEKGNVLLTMLFVKYDFMLIFLMSSASQECVKDIFDRLTKLIGLELFKKYFPVILTDNGCEFKDVLSLEYSSYNSNRTKVFYCDPQLRGKSRILKRIMNLFAM